MNTTDNYKLPLYEGDDNPNLISGYNEAMKTLDATVKENKDTLNTSLETHKKVSTVVTGISEANGIATESNYGHVIVVENWDLGHMYDPEFGYVPSLRQFITTSEKANEALRQLSNVVQMGRVLANGTLKVTS